MTDVVADKAIWARLKDDAPANLRADDSDTTESVGSWRAWHFVQDGPLGAKLMGATA